LIDTENFSGKSLVEKDRELVRGKKREGGREREKERERKRERERERTRASSMEVANYQNWQLAQRLKAASP
jgi:hypothetical protein